MILINIANNCRRLADLDNVDSYSRLHSLRRGEIKKKRTDGQIPSAHYNWSLRVGPKDSMDASFVLLKNHKSIFKLWSEISPVDGRKTPVGGRRPTMPSPGYATIRKGLWAPFRPGSVTVSFSLSVSLCVCGLSSIIGIIHYLLGTVCSWAFSGSLLNRTTTVSTWTQFQYNYMALSSRPILIFAFRGSGSASYGLDEVSVTDVTSPGVEILQNPSFENSSSSLPGWVTWCQSSCGGTPGQVSSSSCRPGSGSLCYKDSCQNNVDFLGQSFPAIVGRVYIISFYLQMSGGGSRFYADVAYWSTMQQIFPFLLCAT